MVSVMDDWFGRMTAIRLGYTNTGHLDLSMPGFGSLVSFGHEIRPTGLDVA